MCVPQLPTFTQPCHYVVTTVFVKARRWRRWRELLSYTVVGMGVEYSVSTICTLSSEGTRYVTVLWGANGGYLESF
jgi:hypothetical protein